MLKNKQNYANNLYSWFIFINEGLFKPLKWQKPIFKILQYCLAGKCSKIMLSVPPQHGKTVLISEAFVSYFMVNNPDEKVIMTGYNQDRALQYGGRVRDIINRYNDYTLYKPTLKQDERSKAHFALSYPYTGSLLAAGAHGSILGNPANLIVIDDPIKELRDANSITMQENLENWYTTTINSRLRKRSDGKPPIMLILAQRLHPKDLQGILKERVPYIDGKKALEMLDNGETIPPEVWIDINMPAICEDPTNDLLGRRKNQTLWPSHKNYEELMNDKRLMGSHRFNALMQGNPTYEKNYVFKHEWFYSDVTSNDEDLICLMPYSEELEIYPKYRFWDLAGSSGKPSQSNDYYCGVLISKDKENDIFYIHEMERAKKQALDVLNTLKETIYKDGRRVSTIIEQEPGSQSVIFLNELQRQFLNYNIGYNKPIQSKLYRSYELKRLAENGSIKFVVKEDSSLEWIHTIINELEMFDGEESDGTRGKHDDIVDSLSSGANYFLTQRETMSGLIKT